MFADSTNKQSHERMESEPTKIPCHAVRAVFVGDSASSSLVRNMGIMFPASLESSLFASGVAARLKVNGRGHPKASDNECCVAAVTTICCNYSTVVGPSTPRFLLSQRKET